MFALTDIRSYCNRKRIYAKRGDEVTIIKVAHPNVILVECKGEKFACAPDKVGEVMPDDMIKVKPIDLFNQI